SFLVTPRDLLVVHALRVVGKGQLRRFVEAAAALAVVGPEDYADEGDEDHQGSQATDEPDIHAPLPFVSERGAEHLQVSDQRVHFGLALDGVPSGGDVVGAVGHAEGTQRLHLLGGVLAVQSVLNQPGVGGHDRLGDDVARVVQVRAVPVDGVAAADAGQVRTGTLGAPQDRVVPDALAGDGVVAVALGFGAERTDHLRVADVAALADVDVAAFQLQRGVGLHAVHRLVDHILEEQRDDLRQAPDGDGDDHENGQQADVLLENFVFHQWAP